MWEFQNHIALSVWPGRLDITRIYKADNGHTQAYRAYIGLE